MLSKNSKKKSWSTLKSHPTLSEPLYFSTYQQEVEESKRLIHKMCQHATIWHRSLCDAAKHSGSSRLTAKNYGSCLAPPAGSTEERER